MSEKPSIYYIHSGLFLITVICLLQYVSANSTTNPDENVMSTPITLFEQTIECNDDNFVFIAKSIKIRDIKDNKKDCRYSTDVLASSLFRFMVSKCTGRSGCYFEENEGSRKFPELFDAIEPPCDVSMNYICVPSESLIDICDLPNGLPSSGYIMASGYPQVSPQASSCLLNLNNSATIHEIIIFDLDTISSDPSGNCTSQYLRLQENADGSSIYYCGELSDKTGLKSFTAKSSAEMLIPYFMGVTIQFVKQSYTNQNNHRGFLLHYKGISSIVTGSGGPVINPTPTLANITKLIGNITTPTNNFTTPNINFTTSTGNFTSPTGNFTTPTGNFTTRTGNFTIPTGNFTTPTGNFTTPNGNFTTPTGNFTTPTGNFTTPTGNFTTPTGNFTTPTGNFTTPNGNFTTPSGNFTTPSGNFTTPTGNFTTPTGNFTTPTGNFTTPTGNFTTHTGNFTTSTGNFTTPTGNFTTPTGNFTTPTGNFTTPIFTSNSILTSTITIQTNTNTKAETTHSITFTHETTTTYIQPTISTTSSKQQITTETSIPSTTTEKTKHTTTNEQQTTTLQITTTTRNGGGEIKQSGLSNGAVAGIILAFVAVGVGLTVLIIATFITARKRNTRGSVLYMTPRKTQNPHSFMPGTSKSSRNEGNGSTGINNNANGGSQMPAMGTEEIDLTSTDSPYAIQNPAYDAFEVDQGMVGAHHNIVNTDKIIPLVDFKETDA